VPFVSELRIFPWGVVPPGWAQCDGQLLSIGSNQQLFSLIGASYGGDGQTTFALPDLRGRAMVGIAPRVPLGQYGGEETHTVASVEMPAHDHVAGASTADATVSDPAGAVLAAAPIWGAPGDVTPLDKRSVAPAGGGQPHANMQPYLALNTCIATQGIYPAPS
jgi:microcystin-dependent protein